VSKIRGLTIDGLDARDLDDAIWVEADGENLRATVAVADASAAVPPGSPVDLEARARVATRYFAAGNAPMLPRALADGALSLREGRPRAVLAVTLTFDAQRRLVGEDLALGTLRSKARLSYAEVPAILADAAHPFHAQLARAAGLAEALLDQRRARGALALYDLNHGWVTTEEGHFKQLLPHEATIGYVVVQELMIAANAAVARWALARGLPLLLRNHVVRDGAIDREDLLRTIAAASATPIAGLEALRAQTHVALERARYGASTLGHYGLNLPAYTHATSPIRRYADLANHRQLVAALRGETPPLDAAGVAELAGHLNATLEAAREADGAQRKRHAEAAATRAVASRRLDALNAKQFERVVKVEVRSGAPPSPAFAESFARRAADDRLPLIGLTVLLTQVPPGQQEAWREVLVAGLAYLERRLPDAAGVLAQAAQVTPGFPSVVFEVEMVGPPHEPVFHARAAVPSGPEARGVDRSRRRAEQRAAIGLLAARVGIVMPPREPPPSEASAPAAPRVEQTKDPISMLNEWCQAHGRPAPSFVIEAKGPPLALFFECRCSAGGATGHGVGATKQDAKRAAARAASEALA